jgi:hypothetical protein
MNTDNGARIDISMRLYEPPKANWRGKLLDTKVDLQVYSPSGFGLIRRFFWFVCFGVRWTKLPTEDK